MPRVVPEHRIDRPLGDPQGLGRLEPGATPGQLKRQGQVVIVQLNFGAHVVALQSDHKLRIPDPKQGRAPAGIIVGDIEGQAKRRAGVAGEIQVKRAVRPEVGAIVRVPRRALAADKIRDLQLDRPFTAPEAENQPVINAPGRPASTASVYVSVADPFPVSGLVQVTVEILGRDTARRAGHAARAHVVIIRATASDRLAGRKVRVVRPVIVIVYGFVTGNGTARVTLPTNSWCRWPVSSP